MPAEETAETGWGALLRPAWLPAVKYLVRAMKMSDARQLATEALALSDPKEIYARAEEFYKARVKVE